MLALLLLLSTTILSHQQEKALELAKTLVQGYSKAVTLEELRQVFTDPLDQVSCKGEMGYTTISEMAEDLKEDSTNTKNLTVSSARFLDTEKNKIEYTTKMEGHPKINFVFEAKKNGQGKYLISSEKCLIVA